MIGDDTHGVDGDTAVYRRFDVQDASDYAAGRPPFDAAATAGAAIQAREVGDGNLNQVFIVSSPTGASAVIKQALPYVRLVGESWPLTVDRNRFEREAITLYGTCVPELVPAIYHADATLALFVMEDLSRLRIVRRALIEMQSLPRLAPDVARFSAETLTRTSDFYLTSAEKKALVARFINPELCKITEDLVLTDPFYDAPANGYEPALRPAVEALWADETTRANVDVLRYAFATRAEALLHGDLHTGSIMASPDETKVVDAEFCFYGPMGFDIGMFIANLFLGAVSHYALAHYALAHCALAHYAPQGMGATHRSYADGLLSAASETWAAFTLRVAALLADAPVWRLPAGARDEFLHGLLRDAVGFAGTEIIRRTIGLARVAELEEIADEATRVRAKTTTLAIGRRLIVMHRSVDSFDQAVAMAREAVQSMLQ